MELQGMLPEQEAPEHTEGYEGFFHLMEMNGSVEETTMSYLCLLYTSFGVNEMRRLAGGHAQRTVGHLSLIHIFLQRASQSDFAHDPYGCGKCT